MKMMMTKEMERKKKREMTTNPTPGVNSTIFLCCTGATGTVRELPQAKRRTVRESEGTVPCG